MSDLCSIKAEKVKIFDEWPGDDRKETPAEYSEPGCQIQLISGGKQSLSVSLHTEVWTIRERKV